MEKNLAFREYSTSNAFVLTLSRNMIDALESVIEKGEAQLVGLSATSLVRRGLVEWRATKLPEGSEKPYKAAYYPTMAGKLLYRLLYEAGLTSTARHPLDVCPIDCTKEEWGVYEGKVE